MSVPTYEDILKLCHKYGIVGDDQLMLRNLMRNQLAARLAVENLIAERDRLMQEIEDYVNSREGAV